jgi:hypothetical protein
LLVAILKTCIQQPLNKQQTIGFRMFWITQCDSMWNIITTPTVLSKVHSLHATLNCLMFSVCVVV